MLGSVRCSLSVRMFLQQLSPSSALTGITVHGEAVLHYTDPSTFSSTQPTLNAASTCLLPEKPLHPSHKRHVSHTGVFCGVYNTLVCMPLSHDFVCYYGDVLWWQRLRYEENSAMPGLLSLSLSHTHIHT